MRNAITCIFTGRFGNQCFQIASVISLALKHNVEYTFQRPTDNDVWKVYFNHFPEINLEGLERQCYNEDVYEYKEIPYSCGLLCLCGYFQSEKYFVEHREQILKAFNFKWEPIKGKVSLHVRRGDYVEGSPFEPITMDYISKAVGYFKKYGYRKFVVFSDDILWCKENVNSETLINCEFEYSEGRNEFEDISLMSSMEHNIIANSTFSWWGAWLNRNPFKVIITPQKWFDGVNKDLIPESWIQI